MKRLFVLTTLIGVVWSSSFIEQCDDKCDTDFDRNRDPISFKSKHNVSKVTNITSTIENLHYMSVEGDGSILMDTHEEAGTCFMHSVILKNKNKNNSLRLA